MTPEEKLKLLIDQVKDKKDNDKKEVERREINSKLDAINETLASLDFKQDLSPVVEEIKNIKIDAPIIPDIKVDIPEIKIPEIKVPNINVEVPEIKLPKIEVPRANITVEAPIVNLNSPDEVSIKKPLWIGNLFQPVIDAIKNIKFNEFKLPRLASEAIPVRLSNGKKFYDAISYAVGGAVDTSDLSKEAKQDITNTKLDSLLAKVDLLQAELNQKTEPEDTQKTIDVVHEHIHHGESFTSFEVISLAAGASRTIIINSNDTKSKHSFFNAYGAEELELVSYEGVTTTSDGTPITKLNRNRNSLNSSFLTIFHTPTGLNTTGSTIIRSRRIGNKSVGGESRMENEFILKNNTKYAVVLTNHGNNAYYLNWWYDWYEFEV